jgi:hypothetical protein
MQKTTEKTSLLASALKSLMPFIVANQSLLVTRVDAAGDITFSLGRGVHLD